MNSAVHPRRRRLLSASGALVLAVAVAACSAPGSGGSSSSGSGGGGGGGRRDTDRVGDNTAPPGPAPFAGTTAGRGPELGTERVEKAGLPGGTKTGANSKAPPPPPKRGATLPSRAI